jgi:predicted Zn-dependent peptidase
MYPFKTTTLNNGLKFIKIHSSETNLVIIQIFMKLGHDLETNTILENGHFIEHLFSMFTSTKYPDGKINRENMSFKNIELDAEIVNKNIKFVLEFHKKHSEYVIDLLVNSLLDFKIDSCMFKQEKNAVIEELNEIIKDSDYKFEKKINSIIFKGHQRAYSEEARLENTRKITIKDVEKYYKTYFSTKNFIIGVFGNLETKYYSSLKSQLSKMKNKNEYKYKSYNINLKEPIIYYKTKSTISNLHIYFNLDYTLFDDKYYNLRALNQILSGDLNALLLKKLRNENGLVYFCSTDYDLDNSDPGLSIFEISTLCNTKNLLKVIKYIFEILVEVKNNYINEKYINAYKDDINLIKSKESYSKQPLDQLTLYSKYYLWNHKIKSFNDEFKYLKNISKEGIQQISNEIFQKQNIVVCYDGSKQMNKSIEELINHL